MKVLLTGFGPFDIFSSNPSEELAKALAREIPEAIAATLPVAFGEARADLLDILGREMPDLVISFGLNGYISYIALERIALNIAYSEVPDNRGVTSTMAPIDPDGPLAIASGLPLDAILMSLRDGGIPARFSFSAGTYLCNEVFYTLMQHCRRHGTEGGFVHIPMASEMIAASPRAMGGPHMPMDMLLRAGRTILRECFR